MLAGLTGDLCAEIEETRLNRPEQIGDVGIDRLRANEPDRAVDGEASQLAARAGQLPQGNEREVSRQIAIICSMTPGERRFPKSIDGSRKRRIASGSGVQVSDVNRLLKNFLQMQKMMKGMGKGGLQRMMRAMGGRLPPGLR